MMHEETETIAAILDGADRKVYRLTAEGVALLAAMRNELVSYSV